VGHGTQDAAGRPAPARRIVVFGNYGNGNLGDEATLESLLRMLRARLPGVEIIAFAMNPDETTARHRIQAEPATRAAARAGSTRPARTPSTATRGPRAILQRMPLVYRTARGMMHVLRSIRRVLADPLFEFRRFQTLRTADILIFPGGGQFSEHVSRFTDLPFPVFKMSLLAKLARTRVLILNVGAGPLRRVTSRWLVRAALRLADYVALRDEASRSLVESIGGRGPLRVYPDIAYGVASLGSGSKQGTASNVGVVGVNLFPHFDGRYTPARGDRYESYLARMATLTMWLLGRGHEVVLFPTQLRADPPVLADLKIRLAEQEGWEALPGQVVEPDVTRVDDLLEILRSTDIVVATRFHGIVLALACGRPVIALSNHSKMDEAMAQMGQEEFLFRADDAVPDRLVEAFMRLEAEHATVSAELAERSRRQRALLDQEFDELFGRVEAAVVADAASEESHAPA
jgi:polysaccharide pyruvyl transferase WcaK-like protein